MLARSRARRVSRLALALAASAAHALAACASSSAPRATAPASSPPSSPSSLSALSPPSSPAALRAYVGATVIASPDAAPLRDATLLLDGPRIAALGPRATTAIPPGAEIVDARGATITAAFWNAHVHLTEPALADAATAPPAQLASALHDLTTRWGFAHVVDTGSDLANTTALRRRLADGELLGPRILTAGTPFVAVGGQPVYIPFPLPTLATPEAATAAVTQTLDDGADAIKLMTASVVARPPAPVMPLPVIRAVATAAHARAALVLAHPTNLAGVRAARDGGVDLLVHTAPEDGPWSDDEARALVAAGVSLVPTLSLWRLELSDRPALADRFEANALAQVRTFAAAGGLLLFGTDTGYRPEHDPTPEHALLARAGLPFSARLAMLTTAPAARFGATTTGRLAPGLDADLVLLDGDPTTDPAAFARVRCTLRRGVILHDAGAPPAPSPSAPSAPSPRCSSATRAR